MFTFLESGKPTDKKFCLICSQVPCDRPRHQYQYFLERNTPEKALRILTNYAHSIWAQIPNCITREDTSHHEIEQKQQTAILNSQGQKIL